MTNTQNGPRENLTLEFQPNFGGFNQPRENVLHNRSDFYLPTKEYENIDSHKQDYGQEQGTSRPDQFKEGNFSLGSKSATSNLSMTYSTINAKFESTIRTEDFMSPQGSYRIPEEDKKAISVIRPTSGEYSHLKKGIEQEFLANQFLQTADLTSQLAQVRPEHLQVVSKENTLKTRQSARTSGGETQFHDAVDHFSDFDVNEMNEEKTFPKEIERYGNVFAHEPDEDQRKDKENVRLLF